MPRPVDPEKLGQLVQLGTGLHQLTEYPEWGLLVQHMNAVREKHTRQLTKRLMRGDPRYLVTADEQLRHAGFWEGVFAVLETPGDIETRLKKMLDTAERQSAQQEEDT